jgi:hypothetical protein
MSFYEFQKELIKMTTGGDPSNGYWRYDFYHSQTSVVTGPSQTFKVYRWIDGLRPTVGKEGLEVKEITTYEEAISWITALSR